jgi:hypothetical protein
MARDAVPLPPEVREPDGWDRPVRHTHAHVLFTDGSWRRARVTGWRRAGGRWFVHLAWPSRQSSWHAHDPRYIHPA